MRNQRPNMIVLPGDGIGPEVIAQAVRIVEWFAAHRGFDCDLQHEEFGATAWHPQRHMLKDGGARRHDDGGCRAVRRDGRHRGRLSPPRRDQAQGGLLRVRREMGVFANLRPVKVFPALAGSSALREEIVRDVDLVVVRELNGGIVFRRAARHRDLPTASAAASTRRPIRPRRSAASASSPRARAPAAAPRHLGRQGQCDWRSGLLWREEMQKLRDESYPEIALNHLYVDNCAMQISARPASSTSWSPTTSSATSCRIAPR